MKCQYHLRESVRLESQDPAKPGSRYVQILWCKNEHSPVNRKQAIGGKSIGCGGDIARCELPAEHQPKA